jgi:hypothetical protein
LRCIINSNPCISNEGLSSLSEEQLKYFNEQYDEILAQGKAEIPILPAPKKRREENPNGIKVTISMGG